MEETIWFAPTPVLGEDTWVVLRQVFAFLYFACN